MTSAVRLAFRSEKTRPVWVAYRDRARILNQNATNPLLTKYVDVVSLQAELGSRLLRSFEALEGDGERALVSYFDGAALGPLLAEARRGVQACGLSVGEPKSIQSLENLWHQVDEFEYPADFPARLVLEVFATEVAVWPHREIETSPARCPHCGFPVLCALLHEEGMGRRRAGCCSLCSSEWALPRLGCLRCGEQDGGKLPLFTFEEWPHIRAEACDSCGAWLKSLDLTKDVQALPVPDDVWSSAINIWAAEQGYESIGNSLFGL